MKKFSKILVISLLLASMILLLASCHLNKDPDKIVKFLDKKGYDSEFQTFDTSILDGAIESDDVEWMLVSMAENQNITSVGLLFLCKDKDAAKDVADAVENYFEQFEQSFKDEDVDFVVEQKGKYAFWGTEDLWELLK